MSNLRVFRMKPPAGSLLMHPKSARALILASSVDEAYGVAFEMLPEDEWEAAEELPPGELIVAFDYFNAARMIVAQSGSAWAAHYGSPLVLRARTNTLIIAESNSLRLSYCGALNLWGGSGARNSACVDAATVNEGGDEKSRRVRVHDFLHKKMAVNVRLVIEEARAHARRFLPMPLRERARAERKR
jgi:hypothetical protein